MRRYALIAFLLICSVASAETIAEKLTRIDNEKKALKSAIEAKGQSVTTFETYSEAVASITTGGSTDPDVFPAGLEEDAASTTEVIASINDTNQRGISATAYCGNGILLAFQWSNPGILRSTNYGVTYSTATTTTGVADIFYDAAYCGDGIIVAPGSHNSIQSIYRSTNYGANWTRPVTIDSTTTDLRTAEYLGSNTILIGTAGPAEIHRSTDRGATSYTKQFTATGKTSILCIQSLGDGVALASARGDSEGIYKTEDWGANWEQITTNFNASAVYSLAYCGNGRVLAGTYPKGCIYSSDDYGETWALATDTTEDVIYGLEYCENDIVYAGTTPNGLILKSVNNGASWTVAIDTVGEQVRGLTYIGNNTCFYGVSEPVAAGNGIIGRINIGMLEKDKWK